jgi:cell division protein FtsZ
MDEIMEITDFIQSAAGQSAEVIWGYGVDESLTDDLCVTVIATGFEGKDQWNPRETEKTTRFVLGTEKEITEPIAPIAPTPLFDASEETKANNEEETPFLKPTPAVESLNANLSADLTEEKESINQAEPTLNEASERDVEEAMKVYTLDSAPLPTTSDEPNLGGIRFHEAKKEETPAPEPAQTPLSQTADTTPSGNRVPIQPVTKQPDSGDNGRNQRIQQFTRKLKTPGGLANLEAEPAYKRRQVILDDVDHSSKSQVSRFTLNEQVDEEGERHIELRNDNPFLHDNVD